MKNFDELDYGPFNNNGMLPWLQLEFGDDRNIYTKFVSVENGDIVVDIGASIGVFTNNILKYNPKHCFIVEPSSEMMNSAMNNLMGTPTSFHRVAISDSEFIDEWGSTTTVIRSLNFKELIDELNINHINFLKFDCEGGEYLIFTEDNRDWILNNVDKISGEFHIASEYNISKFTKFCQTYLTHMPNYRIYSIDGFNITHRLFDSDGYISSEFLNYFSEVIIQIDNTENF
jgi:hypothetical protein